jgi:hypothetical protein
MVQLVAQVGELRRGGTGGGGEGKQADAVVGEVGGGGDPAARDDAALPLAGRVIGVGDGGLGLSVAVAVDRRAGQAVGGIPGVGGDGTGGRRAPAPVAVIRVARRAARVRRRGELACRVREGGGAGAKNLARRVVVEGEGAGAARGRDEASRRVVGVVLGDGCLTGEADRLLVLLTGGGVVGRGVGRQTRCCDAEVCRRHG